MELKVDNLINGYKMPLVTGVVTVLAGEYKRGMILGDVSGIGKLIGDIGVEDTSLNCVVAESKVLTDTGKIAVYLTGEFNKNELIVNSSKTVDSIVSIARKLSIFIS